MLATTASAFQVDGPVGTVILPGPLSFRGARLTCEP